MRTYFVIRHGSNAANQSMTQSMIIGRVEASSRETAKKRADQQFGETCYNNQHLEVKAASRFPEAERESAYEHFALSEIQ